jgi:subtilase family serine protease
MSLSFGESEQDAETDPGYFGPGTNNFGPTELASLASMGTAVFVSSGDNGAEECDETGTEDAPCVNYPATDPSAISVGGVNAPFDNSGRLTGPITGWGVATQIAGLTPGGSGGGCSSYFKTPSYENGVTLPCSGYRTQPDVALDADTNTGVAVVVDSAPGLGGRQIVPVGGTSVSSPEMAAMWALVLQACKASATCAAGSGSTPYRLGNPGPYLYPIYQNPAQYAATFYDVLFGNNALPNTSGDGGLDPGFLAGTGYDQVTGIGVPYAKNLISAVLANVK